MTTDQIKEAVEYPVLKYLQDFIDAKNMAAVENEGDERRLYEKQATFARSLITAAQETERLRRDAYDVEHDGSEFLWRDKYITAKDEWNLCEKEIKQLRARIAELENKENEHYEEQAGWQKIYEKLTAKIAELEKDRPEVVKYQHITRLACLIADKVNDKFRNKTDVPITTLAIEAIEEWIKMHPQGIRIVQDKEGG